MLHTSQFTDPDAARDRHLLVVGYGKSSCDVAHAPTAIAASTTVVARDLIWEIPKKLAGKLNFKHLFLNRLGEGLFRYIRVKGFEAFLHCPGKAILDTGEVRPADVIVCGTGWHQQCAFLSPDLLHLFQCVTKANETFNSWRTTRRGMADAGDCGGSVDG